MSSSVDRTALVAIPNPFHLHFSFATLTTFSFPIPSHQDWFDNLPWRKELHAKAMKIVEDNKSKEEAAKKKKEKKGK